MDLQNSIIYRFGDFRLDVGRRLLFKDKENVSIPPKAFEILLYLIESEGQIVSKNELMQKIWQDSFVEENNLTVNIALIRKVLGEKRGENKFINTVSGRGYRFIAEVFEEDGDAENFLILEEVSTTEVYFREEIFTENTEIILDPQHSTLLLSAKPTSFLLRHKYLTAISAFIILIACSGFLYWKFTPDKIENPTQIQTLAILPFKPLAISEQDALLGIGIADALITKLSGIRKITIRPTSAIAKYAAPNQDFNSAGRELNVDALIEGKIQRNGDKLRVSVQLIRVLDNTPIWANNFETRESDIFALQDSISAQVAESLTTKINSQEREKLAKNYTQNSEAYKLYLNGIFQLSKRNLDSAKLAVDYFEQAIEKQPDYALAYAGLGDAYIMLGNQEALLGALSPLEYLPKAKSALTKALNLDQSIAEAHASMAWVSLWENGNLDQSDINLRRAEELNDTSANIHNYKGLFLMIQGKFEAAMVEMRKAQELDRFSLVINHNIATILFRQKLYDEAEKQCRKTLEFDSNYARSYWLLGLIYEQKKQLPEAITSFQRAVELSRNGTLAKASLARAFAKNSQRKEAENILAELIAGSNDHFVCPDSIALIYSALGDKENAFKYLNQATVERPFSMFQINIEQRFDELKNDPRFKNVEEKMRSSRIS